MPCALLGALLYPLGLDGFVWSWLGLGIDLVIYLAKLIGAAPGASLHVTTFQPYAIICLALALLSMVLWRTWLPRAMAVPFAVLDGKLSDGHSRVTQNGHSGGLARGPAADADS